MAHGSFEYYIMCSWCQEWRKTLRNPLFKFFFAWEGGGDCSDSIVNRSNSIPEKCKHRTQCNMSAQYMYEVVKVVAKQTICIGNKVKIESAISTNAQMIVKSKVYKCNRNCIQSWVKTSAVGKHAAKAPTIDISQRLLTHSSSKPFFQFICQFLRTKFSKISNCCCCRGNMTKIGIEFA